MFRKLGDDLVDLLNTSTSSPVNIHLPQEPGLRLAERAANQLRDGEALVGCGGGGVVDEAQLRSGQCAQRSRPGRGGRVAEPGTMSRAGNGLMQLRSGQ